MRGITNARRPGQSHGQSLVEFVLVTPILLLVLMAGYSFGMGLYQANMAADAIRQPALKKLEMAKTPGAVSTGTVMGYVTGGPLSGNIKSGSPVDSVSFKDAGDYTSIIVGTKSYTSPAPFIPTLNFTATQGIQKNLLLAASNGASQRPAATPWVPGGAVKTPPWEAFAGQKLPPNLELNPGCATVPVGGNIVDAVNSEMQPKKTYISTAPVAFFSPVTPGSLATLAATFAAECANDGAGVCQKEYNDFLPKDYPPNVLGGPPPTRMDKYFEMDNPPGAPGMKLIWGIWCDGTDTSQVNCKLNTGDPRFTILPSIGPNHGWYDDPTGQFKKPPDDFVKSCMARKQAECQLKKAQDKAQQIANAYKDACSY